MKFIWEEDDITPGRIVHRFGRSGTYHGKSMIVYGPGGSGLSGDPGIGGWGIAVLGEDGMLVMAHKPKIQIVTYLNDMGAHPVSVPEPKGD